MRFQDLLRAAPVSDAIIQYAVDIARSTRPQDALSGDWVEKYIKWGAGPRASQFMTLGAKARALVKGRVAPSLADVRSVAPLVLRHRLVLNFNAEADGVSVEAIIENIVEHAPVPK